jgi:hypothetical protein
MSRPVGVRQSSATDSRKMLRKRHKIGSPICNKSGSLEGTETACSGALVQVKGSCRQLTSWSCRWGGAQASELRAP